MKIQSKLLAQKSIKNNKNKPKESRRKEIMSKKQLNRKLTYKRENQESQRVVLGKVH